MRATIAKDTDTTANNALDSNIENNLHSGKHLSESSWFHAVATKFQGEKDYLEHNMEDFDAREVDLTPYLVTENAVHSSGVTTAQFLHVDTMTRDCSTLLSRVSYRLNFCKIQNGIKGRFEGSFKYVALLDSTTNTYRLGAISYYSHDCTGSGSWDDDGGISTTVSKFGVSTTCGALNYDSSIFSSPDRYYYSIGYSAYDNDDAIRDKRWYNYVASVATVSLATSMDLGTPTNYGFLHK